MGSRSDNGGNVGSMPTVSAPLTAEMAAFDTFPLWLRRLFYGVPMNASAYALAQILREQGIDPSSPPRSVTDLMGRYAKDTAQEYRAIIQQACEL